MRIVFDAHCDLNKVTVCNFVCMQKDLLINNIDDFRTKIIGFVAPTSVMGELCLPPSITREVLCVAGGVHCFPRRQIIVSFDPRVIYDTPILRLLSEIDSVCLSIRLFVCTTILERIAGFCFYPKSLML